MLSKIICHYLAATDGHETHSGMISQCLKLTIHSNFLSFLSVFCNSRNQNKQQCIAFFKQKQVHDPPSSFTLNANIWFAVQRKRRASQRSGWWMENQRKSENLEPFIPASNWRRFSGGFRRRSIWRCPSGPSWRRHSAWRKHRWARQRHLFLFTSFEKKSRNESKLPKRAWVT